MNIVIEKDIKVPPSGKGMTKILRELSVGDSFLFDAGLRSNLYSLAKQVGIVLRTKVIKDKPWFVRVWRIA